ncbi:MAG: iron chelate uptake ABC transporter family permease subunit [Planctomycetota bacterium]|nr:iron chelate uptake ABC transporter family permease subunit [Planctomycetota bacterium]
MLFFAMAMAIAQQPGRDVHAPISITNVTDEWPGWAQVFETLTLRAGFNTTTVIVGTTLLGLAAGVIGVFALLRKRSLMTDALSHATLPGIGLAFLAATALGVDGRSLPVLLLGATVTGVLGVVCIQAILRLTRLGEDAAIGIVLSVFFGAGIVTLSYIQANAAAGAAGLNHFIYGQTAAMSVRDAALMGGIAAAAILATLLFLKEFSLVCFNDAFARVDGWPVSLIDLVMMALVVLVTVAGLQAVGLLLVVAMLIVPPVSARFWTERLWLLVVVAALIGALSGYLGSAVSALLPRKPAGSVIVLTSGVVFVISLVFAPTRGVVALSWRRLRMRFRIAGDHLVEAAFEQHGREGNGGTLTEAQLARLAKLRGWSAWFRVALRWMLRRQGDIERAGTTLRLTEHGRARGARVARNHALWEQYLVTYADIAPSHVDWSVDQVEHVLSEPLIAELERALRRRGVVIAAAIGGGNA